MKAILFSILLGCASLFAQSSQTVISGYGTANFTQVKGEASEFNLGFSPIFLWGINDDVLFEAELEFGFEGKATTVVMEYAQVLWVMNDYITLGAGKFLSPNNMFSERYHPSWINKLSSMPLGLSAHSGTQLIAGTQVGVQARNGLNVFGMKVVYSAYVSNGGQLNAVEEEEDDEHGGEHGDPGEHEEEEEEIEEDGHGDGHSEGLISFGLASDNNSNKAIGGRIGFLPIPQLEIGYGFETARIGADGTHSADVRSLNHVIDLNYKSRFILGTLDVRSQYTYLEIDNQHESSYAFYGQVAVGVFTTPVELVVRYDELTAEDMEIDRITYGINYWLNHSTVFKFALGDKTQGDTITKTYSFQIGIGF